RLPGQDAYNSPFTRDQDRIAGMFRFLLIGFAIWLVWRLLRSVHIQVGPVAPPRPPSSPDHYEPMARCARCGTHLPASALSKSGLCGRCNE
ncbi:MAG TPA: hypothetical protein VN046_11310, partial [Stenotrophobium sp.]|nr:hypothetical protein [Stenotrophobium sp.]